MKKVVIFTFIIAFSFTKMMAEKIDGSFFESADKFFKTHVVNNGVDYAKATKSSTLKTLIDQIANADISHLDTKQMQAFFINAYNLNVINQIVKQYPLASVSENRGFFTKDKIVVARKETTLNDLEKEELLKKYGDPRYHFVLVCGANGCPPITNFAYTPEQLEEQLEQQTSLALNDKDFIQYSNGDLKISEIFKWYTSDFGGNGRSVLNYINSYRKGQIPDGTKIKYYNYDWSINDADDSNVSATVGSNLSRYIVSSTIPQGTFEFKIFNNLYSEQKGSEEGLTDRSSFFTTSLSALYGLNDRVNVGISTRYRKVRNNALPSSAFSVFGSDEVGSSRRGLTAFGPQVRIAPVPKWSNFSIQSSLTFPVGDDLQGRETGQAWIDWDGATWWTQFFNDFTIGNKFSLFTEIDLLFEDIGSRDEGRSNRFSTPATLIFSYVPTTKLTFYTIGSYSPIWLENFEYFYQYGVGGKYQFTPDLELELLYTDFTNNFLNESNGIAETINLGLRINIR